MNSPLVTRDWPADGSNYTPGRPIYGGVWGIVIHHAASTSLDSVGQVFSTPGRGGSAHYGVCGNQVDQYVNENDTAWHCGDWNANCGTIGIETINSTGAPDWLIADDTFDKLCELVADIARRQGLGRLKFEPDGVCPNLSAHRDWAATYCPGDYLYSKMYELQDRVNEINYPTPKPEPTPPKVEWVDVDYTHTEIKDGGTDLVDVATGNVIKHLTGEFDYVQTTKDGKYARTEYSKEINSNNGVLVADLVVPAPEPEPIPEPTPTPEPEPEPTPEPKPDEYGKITQFIINIVNFIVDLFKKIFKKG